MKNHGITDDHDHGTAEDMIADGAAAFSGLKISIHHSLFGLRAGFLAYEESSQPVEGNVKVHLAEINTLLEAGNGESSENVIPANPGNRLDLDAARSEISSRLVKLVNQRGS